MVTRLAVDQECQDRNLEPGPNLEDYAMAAAEQWFYRDDALRLGSRKQFCGVCVKPIEILRIISATNKNFNFWFEKQVDPDYAHVNERRYERRTRNWI